MARPARPGQPSGRGSAARQPPSAAGTPSADVTSPEAPPAAAAAGQQAPGQSDALPTEAIARSKAGSKRAAAALTWDEAVRRMVAQLVLLTVVALLGVLVGPIVLARMTPADSITRVLANALPWVFPVLAAAALVWPRKSTEPPASPRQALPDWTTTQPSQTFGWTVSTAVRADLPLVLPALVLLALAGLCAALGAAVLVAPLLITAVLWAWNVATNLRRHVRAGPGTLELYEQGVVLRSRDVLALIWPELTSVTLHRVAWLGHHDALFTLREPAQTYARLAATVSTERGRGLRQAALGAPAFPVALHGLIEPAPRVEAALRAELDRHAVPVTVG